MGTRNSCSSRCKGQKAKYRRNGRRNRTRIVFDRVSRRSAMRALFLLLVFCPNIAPAPPLGKTPSLAGALDWAGKHAVSLSAGGPCMHSSSVHMRCAGHSSSRLRVSSHLIKSWRIGGFDVAFDEAGQQLLISQGLVRVACPLHCHRLPRSSFGSVEFKSMGFTNACSQTRSRFSPPCPASLS